MRYKLLAVITAVFLAQSVFAGTAVAACGLGAAGDMPSMHQPADQSQGMSPSCHEKGKKADTVKHSSLCKCSLSCVSLLSMPYLSGHEAQIYISAPPSAPDTRAQSIDPFTPLRPPIA